MKSTPESIETMVPWGSPMTSELPQSMASLQVAGKPSSVGVVAVHPHPAEHPLSVSAVES
jgi:hypothetical protein